jgi:hypothetical protein
LTYTNETNNIPVCPTALHSRLQKNGSD